MKSGLFIAAVALLLTPALSAQQSLSAGCERPQVTAAGARDACYAAVQAALSGQPALGLVIAGGNPTFGTTGGTGLRLGTVPRTSASVRLNVVGVRLPGIIADELPDRAADLAERFGAPIPSILGDVSIALTDGVTLAPGLGGIGALSFIGSISYLPLNRIGLEGFSRSADFGWGVGGRVHLVQESFIVPGVALSGIRRQVGRVQFGDICTGGLGQTTVLDSSPSTLSGACSAQGDPGEFFLDLTDWSARLVASKHLLGFGISAGGGFDRYDSLAGYGFRAPEPIPGSNLTAAYRVAGEKIGADRWTMFGSASYTLLFGTLGLEAGWQQGEPPIGGFRNLATNFDPESGTWFASLAARLSL